MRPVHQTTFGLKAGQPDAGNCLSACLATVLECDLDEVPHFSLQPAADEADDGVDRFWPAVHEWMAGRGLRLCNFAHPAADAEVTMAQYFPGGVYLGDGKSPRGENKHMVVMRDDELVHDPHPSGDGLDGPPELAWLLVPLDVASFVRVLAPLSTGSRLDWCDP